MCHGRRPLFSFLILSLVIASLLAGCAARPLPATRIAEGSAACPAFMERLVDTIREAGTGNAAAIPVPGFPYLRANRYLAALKDRLADEGGKKAWVDGMAALSLEALQGEIAALPDHAAAGHSAGDAGSRERLMDRAVSCSQSLLHSDRERGNLCERLAAAVKVPDEYSLAMRVFGLYPLAYIPEKMVTGRVRERFRKLFATPPEGLPVEGRLVTYAPAPSPALPEGEVARIIRSSSENALRTPMPAGEDAERLVARFAPVFIQDVAAPYDEPGRVAWSPEGLIIDPRVPAVYHYFTHAFLKENPVLQINYVVWHPQRAGKSAPCIEHGRLDGLTVRVSLDGAGRVFMVDIMNNCGCYHLFLPNRSFVAGVIESPWPEEPYVPQWLPDIPPGGRLAIRVMSGWHQVEGIAVAAAAAPSKTYDILPYAILESLPKKNQRPESMFDATGIGKGSERVERYLFFPMGIPSVGSMRQRGHHAIALTGRLHFDDPYLFEKHFLFN